MTTQLQYPIAGPSRPLDERTEAFSRSSLVLTQPITAGGFVSLPVYGEAFYFIGCSAPVYVKTDTSGEKPYRKGTGERLPQGQRFNRLEIRNPNAFAVEITVWAGFGEYKDNRFEVVDGYTKIRGQATATLAAGAEVVLDGNPSAGEIQRKSLVVSNLDTGSRLDVLDENDNFVCAVFPETSITLPVSGEIKVKNNSGATVACYISEIFYFENAN